MKKVYGIIMIMLLVLVSGCTKVEQGKYKEGTYFGFDETSKTTAVVYADEKGFIKSVFIDVVYGQTQADKTKVYTTKQILGDAYGMKETSANAGVIEGGAEWYEQMKSLSDKVIEEQGIDWLEFKYKATNDEGKTIFTDEMPTGKTEADKKYTDSVAGVTISVDADYKAVNAALDKALK
jgi:major membrane immunogen (membrane-anchored lipoprotein)